MAEIRYRNRRAVTIENSEIRVTVSIEGGHIAEITEKTTGVNPLWSPPWPSIEPSSYSLEKHPEYADNAESKLLAGILGHNLALHLLDFEREIRLEPGGVARIRETVTNLTAMDRPIAWTQHVTLGPPFIEPGISRLDFPAQRSMVFPINLSEHQRYQPGAVFGWPVVPNKGGPVSRLRIFSASRNSAGVTGHAVDEDRVNGFFIAWHPGLEVLCGYVWRRADFPWISLWEENRSRAFPPWNGVTVAHGLEFGASPFAEGRRKTVERGSLFGLPTYRWLAAKGSLTAEYLAFARRSTVMPAEQPAEIRL